ncbi:restriction endonuclease subunit S [Alistipes sp.]|uniref:restriction endonuclease subunit S n=1 Tax=Alistipes sp. TaxID=1872444 RepID=UPI0023F1D245|nr:restriction endonuclease subunit S [Alistipes sp.]
MKNNIPQGYKATALGIIPQEWEVMRLEDLCHNEGDYGINAPATDFSDKLPTYLRITDIDDDGKFIIANKASVNNPNSGSYHLKDGDIVFARTGATVGKTYLYNREDGDLVFAGFLIRFSPNAQKIVPYYLKAYTNTSTYWKWVKITSQRSGQPGINATEYCSLQIPVPPLAEQRKIAEVLGVWDEAIEKQARLIEKLALRKRGLMQRLLSAKLRLPGFSDPWQKVKFCELFTKSIKTADPLTKYEVLSVTKEGIVAQKSYFNKDIASEDTSKYIVVERGDLAMSGLNFWMGSCHILTNFNEGIISPAYKVFKVTEHNNINFIRDFVRSSMFLQALQGCSVIGASIVRRNLDKEMLYEWTFKIPSLKEQTAIAKVLTAADREIELAKEKHERLRHQKRGLMQQLLTGKKRVKY